MKSLFLNVNDDRYCLQCDRFIILFAADGKPSSFRTMPEKQEHLNVKKPGRGFYLSYGGNVEIPLTNVSVPSDGRISASSANESQEVVFRVNRTSTHIAFRIESLKGIPCSIPMTLHFELNSGNSVRVMELDYMTEVHNNENGVRVDWNYLWHRQGSNPPGGFAIYFCKDETEEDDCILHIWSEEKLPHPKIAGGWNYEQSKKWMKDWQDKFSDRSQMILEGMTLEELYAAVEHAEKADIKEIYLFTNTWRNKDFWPMHEMNWHVRRDIFPRGEEDLRRYSDYLKSKGIRLNLHYVSGGIGYYDPVYVGSKPDRRLAGWGRGCSAEYVNAEDTEIKFKPDDGVELPFRYKHGTGFIAPPALYDYFNFHHVRLGDEIIKVGSFEDTENNVWVLKNCIRGMYGTSARMHNAGTDISGLIDTYDANFLPDNESTLLEEIAEGYAGFINRCQISHTEYDGAEIHAYNGAWGYRKFAAMVYSKLDHPVTAHDSGASVPWCHLEYRLNSTRKIMGGTCPYTHGNYSVPVLLDSTSRPATTPLDAHFTLSQGNIGGAMGIARPEPMFGVTLDTLNSHGRMKEFIEILLSWKAASKRMTEEQREALNASFGRPTLMFENSTHLASEVVNTVRKNHDGYEMIPVNILTRKVGDVKWQHGQEHGPISPRQYIKPGQELLLGNPYKRQEAKFIIRVLSAFDYERETIDSRILSEKLDESIQQIDFVQANNIDEGIPEDTYGGNILLQPELSEIKDYGDVQFTHLEEALVLKMDHHRELARWQTSGLPNWSRRMDLRIHRGLGMYVTGDGRGEIILFQIPGRDYIIPVDFTGRKYIEIPNGEVSWHDSRWGWRMETKSTRYRDVNVLKIGFGYVPPQTAPCVRVEGIKALAEIPARLDNPIIRTGTGYIKVEACIFTGQYLEYFGGNTAFIYDKNWNRLSEAMVRKVEYFIPEGEVGVVVETGQTSPLPWLEVQFITEGEPIRI